MVAAIIRTFSRQSKIVICNSLSNNIRATTRVLGMDLKIVLREVISVFSKMKCSLSADLIMTAANEALQLWLMLMKHQTRQLKVQVGDPRCNLHAQWPEANNSL